MRFLGDLPERMKGELMHRLICKRGKEGGRECSFPNNVKRSGRHPQRRSIKADRRTDGRLTAAARGTTAVALLYLTLLVRPLGVGRFGRVEAAGQGERANELPGGLLASRASPPGE